MKQRINSYLCENEVRITHPSVKYGENTHALPLSFDSLGCFGSGIPLGGKGLLPCFKGGSPSDGPEILSFHFVHFFPLSKLCFFLQ